MSNQPEVDIADIIAPAFYDAHRAIRNETHSLIWLTGGRGSTKSSFTAIEIILGIMKDPQANAVALRKVNEYVRRSVINSFLWAIEVLKVNHFWKVTYAPAEFTYLPTGQKIFCVGLEDPQNLKSIRVIKGYLKFLWFEEADQFNGFEELRSVEQTIIRGGEKFVEFITYNPPQDPNNWVNKEFKIENPYRYSHHSTYLDVPPAWLGGEFLKRVERLKSTNYEKYRHEYLGEAVGNADQIIFHGKWEEKEFETPPLSEIYEQRYFYGVDWGFSQDPLAINRCFIKDGCLWIDQEAGGVGIELEEISQVFDKIPEIKRWKIYADNSRPETISFMSRKGYNIHAAPKWAGSVEDGITYLKSFKKIFIHPRCKNTIEEFKIYQYKIDRNTQDVLPVIVDKHNHHIDNIRYSLADYISREVSILDVL